jgi:adenylosuccinate synthase
MVCTVICGGFWGDEGKGKILSYLVLKDELNICVRTGSVNAAHTVFKNGESFRLHMVPGGFLYDRCRLLIGPGANVLVDLFLEEVEKTGVKNRIGVDHKCSIIEEKHSIKDKTASHLKGVVGTTGWGVGPAIEERVGRTAKLARDIPELEPYLTDVSEEVNKAVDAHKKVVLEGTQGFMLSLFHGTYPYVTGRDTSASAICSEAGIGPSKVDHVLTVYKAFVTRVGGGPLAGEISKEEAKKRGWFEIAAGTGRERRSAPFNFELAERSAMVNGATELAVTKLDILYPVCKGATSYDQLPSEAQSFVSEIETRIGVPVVLIGTGPEPHDIIDRRN